MGNQTGIGWTERTWNPIQGCHKVSLGCKNCYMFSEKTRYGQDPNVVVRSKPATFNAPLKWKEPSLIFTCSWSDWFIEDGDAHRDEMWDIIRRTPQHTYQILTKRADRIKDHLPEDWGKGWSNVWLGVSAENQEMADERIPYLLEVPAFVHFVSCEPLLGPIDLTPWLSLEFRSSETKTRGGETYQVARNLTRLGWAIFGGESDGISGKNARECNLDWIHNLTEQFSRADLPYFVKQLGAKPVYPDTETGKLKPFPITSKKGDAIQDFPCHFLQQWPAYWQERLDKAEAEAIAAEVGV